MVTGLLLRMSRKADLYAAKKVPIEVEHITYVEIDLLAYGL